MFRITRDPSSGSSIQCLAKKYSNGSIVSVDMDMVCVCTAQSREALSILCSTHTHTPLANMLP